MPIRTEVLANGTRLSLLCSGEVTGQDIIDAKLTLLADRALVEGLETGLLAVEPGSTLRVTPAEVHAVAEIDRRIAKLVPRLAVAIVAQRDHDFGLARLWEGILEVPGWSSHVFRTTGEAEEWLAQQVTRQSLEPGPETD